MKGDTGPYISLDDSQVWVPRTVPYLEARRIAQEANQNGDRLAYEGKTEDAELVGFVRDCWCEERCEYRYDELDGSEKDRGCLVPAWKFRLVER